MHLPMFRFWINGANGRLFENSNATKFNVVCVEMTAHRQKKSVDRLRHRVMAPSVALIEAVSDFFTMTYLRAPQWMRETGMERQSGDASIHYRLINIHFPRPISACTQRSARVITFSDRFAFGKKLVFEKILAVL
jgi:hypothetical protein